MWKQHIVPLLCFFSNLIHFYFFFLHLQFSSYNFLYMFRTGWSIIRRIKLHVQPLAPFPRSLLSRAWPLVLTKIVNVKRKMKVYQFGKETKYN